MIKKYYDYILLLFVFLLFIFSSNINRFLTAINPNLDNSKIVVDYNKYLKDELDSIRIINDIKIDDNLDLIVSRVKYRNVYEYSDTLTIFKGFKNNDGLIGVISKSYEYYSVVTLLTNKDTNISVKINDAVGVLKCVDGKLVVSDINNYGVLEENDLVYTSGLGNLPANIYIGKVKSVSLNNTEIEKVILVDINDRLEKLDYVFVRGNHD